MRNLLSLFILLAITSTAWADEDYWVWVDRTGVTNYAEHEPDGIPDARHVTNAMRFGERMPDQEGAADAATQDGAGSKASSGKGVDPDAAIAGKKSAIKAEIADIKRRNCEIGKNNLAKLESYSRIRVKADDGSERVLTEQEHQQRIKQARDVIRQNCSS